MTDYKQLCAELVDAYAWCVDNYMSANSDSDSLVQRAHAALAEPEPQRHRIYSPVQIAECGGPCQQGPEHCDCGELWVTEPKPEAPTDEELSDLWSWSAGQDQGPWPTQQHCFARAVLARWGNHPGSPDSSLQQPVPVSECLPRLEDCDAEGRCWWWYPEVPDKTYGYWAYEDDAVPERALNEQPTHWLPAHALPLPS